MSTEKNKIGFLFDMDGLLFDTQTPFHALAESMVCANHGLCVESQSISALFAGISTRKVFQELLPDEDPELMMQEKWEIIQNLLKTNTLTALDGIPYLCEILRRADIPTAIASASPKFWIKQCLSTKVDLSSRFFSSTFYPFPTIKLSYYFGERYVSAEDCSRGKPNPEVFLKAKDLLVSQYGDCKQWFIVGDGRSDVLAGIAADIPVIYLSEKDREFDSFYSVTRCISSVHMVKTIKQLIK